jgi:hypothetical protein
VALHQTWNVGAPVPIGGMVGAVDAPRDQRIRIFLDRWSSPPRLQQRTVEPLRQALDAMQGISVEEMIERERMLTLSELADLADLTLRQLSTLLHEKAETWAPKVREALAAHVVAEARKVLRVVLRYTAVGDSSATLAELVCVQPMLREIDCAFASCSDDVRRMLERLTRPPFHRVRVELLEPHRMFAIGDHPAGALDGIDSASAVSPDDVVVASTDPRGDLAPHDVDLVDELLRGHRDEVATVPAFGTPASIDVLGYAGRDPRRPFIARPRTHLAGREIGDFADLVERSRTLGAALDDATSTPSHRCDSVVDWCDPQERGLNLEHLVLLENLSRASGYAPDGRWKRA